MTAAGWLSIVIGFLAILASLFTVLGAVVALVRWLRGGNWLRICEGVSSTARRLFARKGRPDTIRLPPKRR